MTTPLNGTTSDEWQKYQPAAQESAAERVLRETLEAIRVRRKNYGPASEHFARTVGMINAAFADILCRPLTPEDWAVFMQLDKIARNRGPQPTRDGNVDAAGYAALGHEVSGRD